MTSESITDGLFVLKIKLNLVLLFLFTCNSNFNRNQGNIDGEEGSLLIKNKEGLAEINNIKVKKIQDGFRRVQSSCREGAQPQEHPSSRRVPESVLTLQAGHYGRLQYRLPGRREGKSKVWGMELTQGNVPGRRSQGVHRDLQDPRVTVYKKVNTLLHTPLLQYSFLMIRASLHHTPTLHWHLQIRHWLSLRRVQRAPSHRTLLNTSIEARKSSA